MSELKLFRALLLATFVFQALIDIGGFSGWYYNQYPQEAFAYSGYGAVLPFRYSFASYIAWMAFYYLSLILMLTFSRFAKVAIFASLLVSLFGSFISGIYVGTPQEMYLGWVAWSCYIAACVMVFYVPMVSGKFTGE